VDCGRVANVAELSKAASVACDERRAAVIAGFASLRTLMNSPLNVCSLEI
jgi:hypothetical protein